jgi:FSR family fosmidomycin resistance protein-like MFS transporter
LIASTSSAAVLVAAFIALSHGGSLPIALDFVFAGMIGLTIVASQASFIVLGQEYLPNRIGIATGVTMGLAVSVGGLFSPVFGRIGDVFGLAASMWTIVGLTCAALTFALFLPPHARRLPYLRSGNPSPASAS